MILEWQRSWYITILINVCLFPLTVSATHPNCLDPEPCFSFCWTLKHKHMNSVHSSRAQYQNVFIRLPFKIKEVRFEKWLHFTVLPKLYTPCGVSWSNHRILLSGFCNPIDGCGGSWQMAEHRLESQWNKNATGGIQGFKWTGLNKNTWSGIYRHVTIWLFLDDYDILIK